MEKYLKDNIAATRLHIIIEQNLSQTFEQNTLHNEKALENYRDCRRAKYNKVKSKQISLEAEKQLEREIQAQLSGLDDILGKALKGMSIENEEPSAADQIIKEIKQETKEEQIQKLDLNRDSLHNQNILQPKGDQSVAKFLSEVQKQLQKDQKVFEEKKERVTKERLNKLRLLRKKKACQKIP